MIIPNDILACAKLMNESQQAQEKYVEACKKFEETKNLDVDEAMTPEQVLAMHSEKKPIKIDTVVVDDKYIKTMKQLMKKIQNSKPDIFLSVLEKLHEYKEAKVKLPPPEDFVETFIEPSERDKAETNIEKAYKDTDNVFGNDMANSNMYDSEEIGEAGISVDDLLKLHADKKEKEEQKSKEEEQKQEYISEIQITSCVANDISKKIKIIYDIIWSDGKIDKDQVFECDSTDEEFIKASRQMGAKTPKTAACALLIQSYDSNSKKPIKWTFYNKSTGVKTDAKHFPDLITAKQRKVKLDKIDPAKEYAAELARAYNKNFGSSTVRYTF